MTTQMTDNLRFLWTARAVKRFLERGTYDPRHTVSSVSADLASPWLADDFDRLAGGSPWVLVNQSGEIVARNKS